MGSQLLTPPAPTRPNQVADDPGQADPFDPLRSSSRRSEAKPSRQFRLSDQAVTFSWKDYRLKGRDRQKTMTFPVSEFTLNG
jgi:hypothetical protein